MKTLLIHVGITTALITTMSSLTFAQNDRYLRLGNVSDPELSGTFTEFIDLKSIKRTEGNSYKYTIVTNPGQDRTETDAIVDCTQPQSIYLIESRYYEKGRFIKRDKINYLQDATDTEYSLQSQANSNVCRLFKQNQATVNPRINSNLSSPKITLQPGAYLQDSKQIIIVENNDKFCYVGINRQAAVVSSLERDSQNSNVYQIYKFNASLVQKNRNIILFDNSEYSLNPNYDMSVIKDIPEAADCLRSKKPYHIQIENRWG